jgi:hypothetical protein
MTASVSNPAPHQRSDVTVYGQLTVNGVGVAGLPMSATWYYRTTTSSCAGTTDASGTASCTRNISSATAGYTVRIVVAITYNGQSYSASTSFTPQ